jgi:hypothetical protein
MYFRRNKALRRPLRITDERNPEEPTRGNHGRTTLDRLAHGFVRTRRHSGQALYGDAIVRADLLQHAAQGLRLPAEAAVRLPQGRRGRRARRHRQGLRVREGPVRRLHAEEIKALEEVGTHAVEISEFVPIEAIDPSTSTRPITSPPTRARRSRTRCSRRRSRKRSVARSVAGRPRARRIS